MNSSSRPSSLVIGAVAVMLALFVLACGSGSPSPAVITSTAAPVAASGGNATGGPAATAAPAASAVGNVGDRIEANGMAMTVTKISRADSIGDYQKAKAGNTFIIAQVLIESVSADKAPYNPLYFTIKDADGFEYDATFSAGDQSLKSGDLAKGEKTRGSIAVEVKKDAKGLVLTFKPIRFGDDAPIRVAVK